MKASLLRVLMALFVVTGMAVPALAASDFPNRTVRILVGFAPGGTTDLLARIVADELRSKWNTAVVIENRPGADGIVASTAVHNAPPDGYTPADEHKCPGDHAAPEGTSLQAARGLRADHDSRSGVPSSAGDAEAAGGDGQGVHRSREIHSWRADLLLSRAGQRPVPGHAALHASVRSDEYGPRPISRFDAGRHGAGHSGCSVDVFVTLDDAAAVPGRQAPRACGIGPTARPERARRPDLGGVRSARFRKQHLVRSDGAVQGAGGRLAKIRTDVAQAMRSPTVLSRIAELKSIPVGNTSEEFRKVILSDYEIFGRVIANAK